MGSSLPKTGTLSRTPSRRVTKVTSRRSRERVKTMSMGGCLLSLLLTAPTTPQRACSGLGVAVASALDARLDLHGDAAGDDLGDEVGLEGTLGLGGGEVELALDVGGDGLDLDVGEV